MAEKKNWRDYTQTASTKKDTSTEKTGGWRDYVGDQSGSTSQSNGSWRSHSNFNDIVTTAGKTATELVNNWLNKHNSYLTDYQKRYEGRKNTYEDAYVSDSADWLTTAEQRKHELDNEAESFLSYLAQYERYLDAGWVNDVKNTIANARSAQGLVLKGSQSDYDYWSKFMPNEEQTASGYTAEQIYKEWQKGQKQYAEDQAYDVEAGMLELEALKKERDSWVASEKEKRQKAEKEESFWDSLGRWLGNTPDTSIPLAGVSGNSGGTNPAEEYDNKIAALEERIERAKYVQGYEGYMDNIDAKDYATNSQYVSTRTDVAKEDALWGLYKNQYDESKLFGDFLYDYINRNEDALAVAKVNNVATNAYLLGFDKGFLQTMTDDEIGVYNYIYKSQGKDSANEYLSFLQNDLQGRKKAQEQAYWANYAKEDPFGSSAFSVLISPLKGLSYLGQATDMLADGKMEQNAGYNRFSYIPTTIQSTVSNGIEKNWGKVGSFAYNTGMSMANFLFTTAVSGGNQALSLAIMGSGAAADATISAKDRGLGDGEAFTLGTIAGLAEVAMEKISLGAWLEGDMTEGALRYMLNNALSEGIEEAGTSVVNLLADVIIAGDKSEWNVAMQAYIDEGKTPEEAFGLVAAEQAAQIGLDALGGILSGGVIGGGTYAGTSIGASADYGDIAKNKESAQKLVAEGLELNPKNQYVQKMQSKLEKGKSLSGMQVRNILAANKEQITSNDMKKIQQAAENRLTSLGQTKDVSEVAEIATKWATGQELTRAEKKLLTHSEYGSRVANELLPSNIDSEDYSTEWAEEIGTEIVNAKAYNKKTIRALLDAMASMEDTNAYKSLESRAEEDTPAKVSDTGNAVIRATGEEIDMTSIKVKEISKDSVVLDVNGKDVDTSEIDFANDDQWNMFNAIKKIEHITPGVASAMIAKVDMAKPVWGQLNGMDEAFTYGFYNYSETDLKAGLFTGNLTKEQLNDAYKLGQYARGKSDVDSDAPVVKMRTEADAKLTAEQKTAKQKAQIESNDAEVYFQDGKSVVKFDEHTKKYDKKRMAAVNTARFLTNLGIGGKYYFYESYVNSDGDRVYKDADGNEVEAPNGIYQESDGSIHIDLNAGDYGQGTALFTLGHELTHFVKDRSKKQFKILADLVTEAFDKTDMSMHERVLAKQKFLSDKRGKKVSYDEAYEEVVADAMSTMISDGSFHEKLMEIKVKDKGLFETIKRFFQKMIAKFRKVYEELTPDQKDAQDIRAMKDMFDSIQNAFVEALVEASDNFQVAMESVVESDATPMPTAQIVTDDAVVTDGNGERHSIRSMKHDIAEGKMFDDLKNVCGWTNAQVNTLRNQLKDLVEYMIPYRNILDMNEPYGMEGRRFSPYKPNSDPLYKISMDFSTLCSKRLLTQYVIENLQLREGRPMSAEEQMAIRSMLNEYRKVEKGLQVACAMCYVEAARLKSPNQIQKWMDDPSTAMRNYFADKNPEFAAYIKKAQGDFKESKGYDRNATKKDMKPKDRTELNKIRPRLRNQYQPSAEELAVIEKAKSLPNSTYLTAGNLANLSETDPVIYDAYTAFVRTATRSKSLETDEPYYYGDSTRDNGNGIVVTDSFIEAVNRENGMRFSSWSDWRIQHLLDYITAVIDNSVRGAAMHGYTKFGDEVRVLGKTGMMFNMSGVTGTQTGLNEDGSLNFSDTESIDVNEAIQLRDEFPDTAGLQCIGVGNEHIIALLRSDLIDYVIPYHVSGLNAALRRMADIHGWKDYTGTQHALIDKSIKLENAVDKEHWREEPVFSEFFVGYDTGMSGIEAMRASAEKYKQMCKDRGLVPKFEQFASEDNYWKLLIDRKMINQKTGDLIQQKAVTPTFDFNTVKGVVDKFVENYDAGLEARALNHIVENWDSIPQRIKDLKKQGSTKAKNTKKAVETLANQTVAAQPKDGVKNSDRKWKPNLDSTEWGIVNYAIEYKQGTAITNTCNMFFKKSKGSTVFGIYSTDDSTLLYASRGETAEKEHIFVDLLGEEHDNGNVTDTSAEGLRAWSQTVRMQQTANNHHGSGNVAPGRSAGNADLHGGPSRLYSSAALRNVLENIFQKETAGRAGDGSVKNSDRSVKLSERINTDGMSAEAKKIISDLEIRAKFSRFSKGAYASYSAERIDRELERSSASKMDYAKSYIAWVEPLDFLYATTISEDGRSQIEKEAGELDLERLRKQTQPIHLTVDFETGKIVGHEGRHRMIALHKAGVEKVAVIFDAWNDDIYNTKPVDMMRIGGQEFSKYHGGLDFYVHDMLPLSKRYADATRKLFSEIDGSVKFSERGEGYSNRDMLANAFEGITNGSDEYKLIQRYKSYIAELNSLENKLYEFKRQIHEIRFGKGKYDAEKLTKLESEAEKIADSISKYDQYLISLEASEPLRKVIERERKKEAQKTKDHVKEIQQNKKVRAEQTELRHKIRKTIRDLDKILNRGNKKQNVKEDMKGFVSKALELADYLFTDHISNDDLIRRGITVRMTPKEAALVKETEDILSQLYDNADSLTDEEFTRLDAKRKANEDKLRDLLTSQRNERLNTPVYNLFNDLVTEYASLKNSNQDAVKAAYNDEVERLLRSFLGDANSDREKALQNMRVADMTTDELWKLYNAYTMVLTTVRDANKFFAKGMTESIDNVVTQIVMDFGSRKIPDNTLAVVAQKLTNKIGWDYEKLYYALDRIGSDAFTKLIMNIADSENTVMQDIMEAVAFRDQIVEKYGFNNWDVNKKIDREFLDNTGKKFTMTLGELMSLYAYSRRKGAWDHIEYGGFVFGEKALTNPKPADSYKLSKEQCEAITSLLTNEQKAYVEDMQKFLSETMGEKGNEVSMQLYGIKMFKEKNYFPIHIAGEYQAKAQESKAKQAAGFGSMSNAGFTHEQNPNAKAPFVLEGFNEIWSDHVNEMSRYHGTVPALEDLRRVMNRSSYSESTAESTSVQVVMENHFGEEAVKYFDNLYREANSGATMEKLEKWPKKLLSLFRKNSVAYSLSVLIQQPASIVRAYAMIDKKYFGYKGFGTITSGVAKAISDKWTKAHTNAYNEMLKYAPGVTMAKEIGGFDTATGGSIRRYLLDTGKSFGQKVNTDKHGKVIGTGKAVLDFVNDNAIANLPNVADKIAWIEIWNACKRETVAKHKDLATSSEEFMQIVGDRFTEVIRATQVYDSIFAKSPMLKSKYLAVQYLVSFMNEPNTVANMAEKAVRDAIRGDWKKGAKTAAVVAYSIIFTNVLKSIIYAMRDDDEDETYIEKYVESIVGGVMNDINALNYIPLIRDVVSIAQGYDVERADMAIVADFMDAIEKVNKYKNTETDGMTEEQLIELEKKQTEANWKLVESLAAFFGIPVKNIRREVNGVVDHFRIASANAGMTTANSVWDKVHDAVMDSLPEFLATKATKSDKLYDAIVSGDKAYLGRIKSTYKTDDAYQSAVRKALRENDSRIHDAAQARYDGNVEEYKRIFREIQGEGKFNFDDIMSAINSEESKIRNKLEQEKVTSQYSASGFVESVILGDTRTAQAMKEDIIAAKVANGKTQNEAEKEFTSAVTTGIHDAYSSGLLDEARAKNMLLEYTDMDKENADSRVGYWAFCEDNPKYANEISESKYNKYKEFAEPESISLDVFVQYIKGTKDLTAKYDEWGEVEVSEREQVLDVIDSLPLTWQQKDALYLAHGYAESKIWDVPW